MIILFNSDYYRIVCVLDEANNKIAVASYNRAKDALKGEFNSLLENSKEIDICSDTINEANGYKYICSFDKDSMRLNIYR